MTSPMFTYEAMKAAMHVSPLAAPSAFLAAQDRPELERRVRNELIARTSMRLDEAAVAAHHVVDLLLGAPGVSSGVVSDPEPQMGDGAVSRGQTGDSPGAVHPLRDPS